MDGDTKVMVLDTENLLAVVAVTAIHTGDVAFLIGQKRASTFGPASRSASTQGDVAALGVNLAADSRRSPRGARSDDGVVERHKPLAR
jgi:hypothetical protein